MNRKTFFAAAVTAALASVSYFGPARAEGPGAGKPPSDARTASERAVTVRDAMSLAIALRNLDGHLAIIKQNGQDATVMVPWEFGSGSLRLRIASDLAIASLSEKAAEDTRLAIVKEILKKSGGNEVKPGTPDYEELVRQYEQATALPAPGARDLAKIKASELKLDKNEIPVTVLQALWPILEQDQ